jgi:putative hydrolase of the HAD superfamily
MDEKGLGRRLQAARQAAGFTQQALCQKASLSYSTLAKIERGAIKSPSIFTIQSIAAALNMALDDLLGVASPNAAAAVPKKVSKSGVRFAFFDINGCLVRFFHQAFTRLAAETGEPLDAVESAFWHYNDEVCRGTMSLSDFNAALAERLHLPTVDWQAYYLDAIEPITEMHEVVRWAAENYRIGLLTNIMPGFVDAMRSRGLLPDVPYDVIIDSSQVGAIKPEAEIYRIAAERAQVAPAEILLIDDSRANLMAAEHSGWHVLWFDDYRPQDSAQHVREALEPAA